MAWSLCKRLSFTNGGKLHFHNMSKSQNLEPVSTHLKQKNMSIVLYVLLFVLFFVGLRKDSPSHERKHQWALECHGWQMCLACTRHTGLCACITYHYSSSHKPTGQALGES